MYCYVRNYSATRDIAELRRACHNITVVLSHSPAITVLRQIEECYSSQLYAAAGSLYRLLASNKLICCQESTTLYKFIVVTL